jgi:hypothetical protein
MPGSYTGLDDHFLEDLSRLIKPATVFDVGVGHGKVAKIIRSKFPEARITGWEVFPVELHETTYDTMLKEDFLVWTRNNVDWQADLVVFGDVLEHFRHSEALDILQETA